MRTIYARPLPGSKPLRGSNSRRDSGFGLQESGKEEQTETRNSPFVPLYQRGKEGD
jgi:hypothetical protein